MATADKKISELPAKTSLSDTSQALITGIDNTEAVASNRNFKMTVDNFKTVLDIQGGMTANERANQNNLIKDVARLNYANSLNAIAYKGGFYDIFADSAKIASTSQVVVSTLDGGDPNGKVELGEDITGWNAINTASYDSLSFSVASQDTTPNSVFFNPSKTKMFILGGGTNAIYQYTLGTAGDPSTATYDSVSFSVSGQCTFATGLFFKPDGTKFYVQDSDGDIFQYTCSTGYDLTTASYDSVSLPTASSARGMFFRADGLRFYVLWNGNIIEYSLATAWANINTNTFISQTSINGQDNAHTDLWFKSDGTKLYILGNQNNSIYQYTLNVAWDSSDYTYDSLSFSVGSQETNPNGLYFDEDGVKFYVVGQISDSVFRYNIGTNNGFLTSGNFVTTSIDLTADLSEAPNQVVVSSEFATPTDTTLSVTISDGTNTVTITSANFDTEVDCSALTTRTLTATWNLATTDTASTPTITNYALYFTT